MFEFDKRGALLSASAGLTVGLIVAWVLWYEAPPPREASASVRPPSVSVQPAAVVKGDAPPPVADTEPPRAAEVVPPGVPMELVDLAKMTIKNGRMIQDLGQGRVVELSIHPGVQARAIQIMEKADVPFGALVAMEPRTGRVLSYAQYSALRPGLKNIAGLANPPAASVFKVVTAAALLEEAKLSPKLETCYHGGSRRVLERHLEENPKADTLCRTLGDALGRSTNVIFARLASRRLNPAVLDRYARAFGWNKKLPFLFDVEVSRAQFSDDRLTFARTAAGFYNTHLSPLHGALVAGAVANRGLMVAPKLVDRYLEKGVEVVRRETTLMGRSIQEKTALLLTDMMVNTTTTGTASAYFRKRDKSLAGVRVAAKTGTLSAKAEDGTRHSFSWWIGFAPADNPRIALSALVVNVGAWRIKSSYLAREVLEHYFENVGRDTAQREDRPRP